MFPERVLLIDNNAALARAWQDAFRDLEGVEVHGDDFFARPADALVSPANSFGYMDGGLDLAILDHVGHQVQRVLQEKIRATHHGELPVGAAEIVETGDGRWPFLVSAPTMRVPENVAPTLNPYLAFRAALLAVVRFNQPTPRIRTLVCPGLGTGIGHVPPARCTVQMRMAFLHARDPAVTPSFQRIHALHQALRGA